MTGNDAEILCGEWETGDTPSNVSEEGYNIVLNIREIVKHPDYKVNVDSSAYLQNDIAVFKVDDTSLSEVTNGNGAIINQFYISFFKATTMQYGIYPACLPIKQRTSTFGVHSGWSSPIPFHLLWQYAPGFTKVYRDFFKQIHYKMEVQDQCQDANKLAVTMEDATFPTNTYYPPGTVCARNYFTQSCFYSGESGSPLMMRLPVKK